MNPAARAGFSLVEALVVLAVTAVLLVLLLQISTGATRAGFRLASRADAAGDRLVGAEALRTLLRGVRLPGRDGPATPFVGDEGGFTAAVTPGRATPCGDEAPGIVSLRLDGGGGRTRLICVGTGGRTAVLLDLGTGPAAFSYALAGRPWAAELRAEPPPARPGSAAPAPRPRLWIRLAADPHLEWVEAVDAPAAAPSVGAGAGA